MLADGSDEIVRESWVSQFKESKMIFRKPGWVIMQRLKAAQFDLTAH